MWWKTVSRNRRIDEVGGLELKERCSYSFKENKKAIGYFIEDLWLRIVSKKRRAVAGGLMKDSCLAIKSTRTVSFSFYVSMCTKAVGMSLPGRKMGDVL